MKGKKLFKKIRWDRDFDVNKGVMAELTGKKIGGMAGSENPIVDPLEGHCQLPPRHQQSIHTGFYSIRSIACSLMFLKANFPLGFTSNPSKTTHFSPTPTPILWIITLSNRHKRDSCHKELRDSCHTAIGPLSRPA